MTMLIIDPRDPSNRRLMQRILGPADIRLHPERLMLEDNARQITGRHIVGDFVVPDADGRIQVRGDAIVTRRRRVLIPRGHPWRGRKVR
jgi:hypothetical protein